ncbi:hypothetical protein LC612_33005 [Nostoc sp. CHAB 5834]|nr:hypothetical protein [Nostoc sp. CHAB 5834]
MFPEKRANSSAAPTAEPKAISFQEHPTSTPAVSENPSPEPVKQPSPLVFPAAPQPSAASSGLSPGRPAFSTSNHPLHSTVLAKAREIGDSSFAPNEARIDRLVSELLPLKTEVIENYGQHMLEQLRLNSEHANRVVKDFNDLKSAEALESVLKAVQPKPSVKGRVLSLLGVPAPRPEVTLTVLRPQLQDILRRIRTVAPEVDSDRERISALLLALRSTSEVSGTPQDLGLERAINQRLRTLLAALQLASMLPAQLKSTESLISQHLAECDRLNTIAIAASQLSAKA